MNKRVIFLSVMVFALFASGWWLRGYYARQYPTVLIRDIQARLNTEFEKVYGEATAIMDDSLLASSPSWDQASHFFFHVSKGKVKSWNHNFYLPNISSLPDVRDSLLFLTGGRGDYLLFNWAAADDSRLYCLVTLSERYPITNSFLSPQVNRLIIPDREIALRSAEDPSGDPVMKNGKVLFKVLAGQQDKRESWVSFLLISACMACILLLIREMHVLVRKMAGEDVSFVTIIVSLLFLRAGMEQISWPSLLLHSDLFDPRKFASSSINASMGDLFINALIVLILMGYLFTSFRRFRIVQWALDSKGGARWIAGIVALSLCFFGWLFAYNFVEVIYHNSSESLDITQSLQFDTVRIFAMISVALGCLSSFLFIHVLILLVQDLLPGRLSFISALAVAALLFWFYYFSAEREFHVTLVTGVFFLILLRVLNLRREIFTYSFSLFLYLICMVLSFSFQTAWAARIFGEERQVNNQMRFGKDFLTDRDFLGEYLLHEAGRQIESDPFVQARMSGPVYGNNAVMDRIRGIYLSRYFDRYETSIEIYNEVPGKTQLVDFLPKGYTPTGYPGIGYANTTEGKASKGYYVIIPVGGQHISGYILLQLTLKRIIPNSVYPELLVDNRFSQIYRSKDFSYAIYSHGALLNSFGAYNYDRDFSFEKMGPDLFGRGIRDGNYYHVAIESPDEAVAVVSALVLSTSATVANFSYWFVLGLAILFIAQGANGLYSIFNGQPVSFAARIQIFVFLSFLLPAVAISIITLTLIGKSSEEGIQNEFLDRSTGISQSLAEIIEDKVDASGGTGLERWIEENAASSKLDINVFSADGTLMATSQPALLDNQLISPLMDHAAWKRLVLDKEVRTVTNEKIGKLEYNCAYSAIQSPGSGKLIAIVGLPFFESALFMQRSQVRILSSILVVFVLTFILFSFLSYWASRSLTLPIRFITGMLGKTTLTGQNAPLQWNSSDEIGMLIKEYNRMVRNLEESREALAKNEKELAWREMARQVAHEIKNPLTPMRLTLQQMERNLLSGNLSEEKSRRSVEVLLKQVDILNQIADSFSLFAKMPTAAEGPVDMNGLVQSTVNLLSSGTAEFKFQSDSRPLLVKADQPALSRAFANILINAMQAGKEGQEVVHIDIRVSSEDQNILVTIRDDGRGMAREVQEKIFQPHFTTKESGSGLGLAMARQIIDQAGGRIWFESEVNKGTSFFVKLPRLA